MADFNKVILMGRLCADPEQKTTQSGISVTSFRLAINRKMQKDTTDFIDIVAWRQTAEFVCKWFKKGDPILVCGSMQSRNWEDKQGNKRTTIEVVADEATFTESKGSGNNESGKTTQAPPSSYTAPEKFEEVDVEQDFPF